MAGVFKITKRCFTTSSVCEGKRNFRKFMLSNKRGSTEFKKRQAINPDPDIPIDKRGVRDTGYKVDGKFQLIPEMVPELIVPNLEGFTLKPYVSYRSTEVVQSEFTAQDLFNVVYADKIRNDFNQNKLNPQGEPLEPNSYEKLTPEEAKQKADKTGSDIF